jgi:hypothetical protein
VTQLVERLVTQFLAGEHVVWRLRSRCRRCEQQRRHWFIVVNQVDCGEARCWRWLRFRDSHDCAKVDVIETMSASADVLALANIEVDLNGQMAVVVMMIF